MKLSRSLGVNTGLLAVGIIFGVLNITTAHSGALSAMVAVVEYVIVGAFLINHKNLYAFKYFLLFSCLSVELDAFVTGDSSIVLDRFSFFRLPLLEGYLYILLSVIIYVQIKNQYKNNKVLPQECFKLRKWLWLLYISGIASIIAGMMLNDNGIMNWGYYPKYAIAQIISFMPRFLVILTAVEVIKDDESRNDLAQFCESTLVTVAISTLIAVFVFGMTGFYADYEIMLTPLSIALTPLLIAFFFYKESVHPKLSLISGILIVIGTFLIATPIGSKWYLIILAAFAEGLILATGIKSVSNVIIIGAVSLILVTVFAEPILDFLGNDYVGWKLSQAIKLINLSGGGGGEWYGNLDHSTLYRFDEPHNAMIEFSHKPWFAVFGKGFGGTTLHYTDILAWETDSGAFPEMQSKMGAFSQMHETVAAILLRHGLVGVIFMVLTFLNIFKRISYTPWAMVAFIWFVFYWSYGEAIILGSVALVLAYSEKIETQNDVSIKRSTTK